MTAHSTVLFVLSVVTVLVSVQCQQCPDLYRRFSAQHTYCKPSNRSCQILDRGVTAQDKQTILKVHNDYRNKVALGQENRAGGLPQAADMIEMVWDDELAGVAQKLSDSCVYGHDCHPCRQIGRFIVGQNIGRENRRSDGLDIREPHWPYMIGVFIDEVAFFHKNKISPFVQSPKDKRIQYGHLTQILWSTTWKIGCGWTVHRDGDWTRSYHACNYAPSGNVDDGTMYKAGSTCSACPANTCCGSSCRRFGVTSSYPGLCKVIDESQPPEGNAPHVKTGNELLYCGFNGEQDCQATFTGADKWRILSSDGGSLATTVLNGGESTTVTFNKAFRSSTGQFCFQMLSRRGPNVDGDEFANTYEHQFHVGSKINKYYLKQAPYAIRHQFMRSNYPMRYPKNTDIKYGLTFSVPPGKPSQFVDIQMVAVKEGPC